MSSSLRRRPAGWGGYPDGSFKPDQAITRAEVTSVTNRMLNRHGDLDFITNQWDHPELITFTDVQDKGYWAFRDIMEATNAHLYTREADGKQEAWNDLLNEERDNPLLVDRSRALVS